MNLFPTSAWRYVLLIVILFAIVAVAANFIIAHLWNSFPEAEYAQSINELSLAILALTFGCLFLAGALGLWAVRSTAEMEARRRIGRFVDAMDYFSDGLLVLDRNGQVTGSNPAARQMAPRKVPDNIALHIRDMFPNLTDDDLANLLERKELREIERDCIYTHGLRTLRFRSQPAEGGVLVLIGDVTELRSKEIRRRQVAQLQLIGRIAAGMAHDFNNILCAISGHAALLGRRQDDPAGRQRCLNVILKETEKGSLLSRQLLGLSRSGTQEAASERLPQDLEDAAALLRVALAPAWTVKTMIAGQYRAVPLASAQIEQVVLNLGLLVADAHPQPGTVMLSLQKPGPSHLLDVGDRFAAVIIVSAAEAAPDSAAAPLVEAETAAVPEDEVGVILSVVKSMVEQTRGRLDQFTASTGICLYRVCLPHLDVAGPVGGADDQADKTLERYLAGWKVLLGGAGSEIAGLKRHLERIGTAVIEKTTVVALLAHFESAQPLDAIVVDKQILGLEADGLLKAMLKLCPRVAIVVLCHDPRQEPAGLGPSIVFVPYGLGQQQMLRALVDAKGQVRLSNAAPPA